MDVLTFIAIVFIYSFLICVLSVFIAFSFIAFNRSILFKEKKGCLGEKFDGDFIEKQESEKEICRREDGRRLKEHKTRQELYNFLNYDGGIMPEADIYKSDSSA